MIVPIPDRNLLNGGFDELEGIPPDQMWITRYFQIESNGWLFCIYYLKMKQLFVERGMKNFITLYQEHTGADYSRKLMLRSCRMIVNLENAAQEASIKNDFNALSALKLGQLKKGK